MAQPPKRKNNPISGALYLMRGLFLIGGKGIRRFVFIPLLINILLFSGAIYAAFANLDPLMALVANQLPGFLSWLTWLIKPLLAVAVLLIVFFSFSMVANLIAAPFNGPLADAVERKLTGRESSGEGGDKSALVKDIAKSLYSELRKLLYFLIRIIPLLLLLFIPVVGTLLWILFSAWMLAVEYAAYPMDNHKLLFPRQRKVLAERRMLSLGFGGAVSLAIMIPVVNFLVMPAAVAGATAMWVDQLSATKAAEGSLKSD